jgi:hypothetical protein|tara:strand:- start:173 stop:334 length:162 start_codon:yes stop_codon:yes gene_type:complete
MEVFIFTNFNELTSEHEICIEVEGIDSYGDAAMDSSVITKEMLLEVLGQHDKD